jgi:hypothetical protein
MVKNKKKKLQLLYHTDGTYVKKSEYDKLKKQIKILQTILRSHNTISQLEDNYGKIK